ncbi:hypothetical protein C121_81 [Stenotrophomonas phage C121]|uniref:tail length tape measure protein n=1 Tax=Stenotrophomonas phage C121 TaxID=2914029 RepID=UPI0023294B1D|nr:tail length tape measure protein [Stenotrophomonas phage C121]UKL14814.1 hypothetical protein C121_81 [Stenotrophomonas phage C121]
MPDIDWENLSDDDIRSMGEPPAPESQTPVAEVVEPVVEENVEDVVTVPVTNEEPTTPEEEEEVPTPVQTDEEIRNAPEPVAAVAPVVQDAPTPDPEEDPVVEPVQEVVDEFDYKAAYEELLAPFKANGRTVELKDPKDLKSLAQMGANYTKNMQDLAPHRRTLMTLQKAGITEDQLSYLIDLHQKKPEAVRRLVQDAQIDPLSLDNEPVAYTPTNHMVSAKEEAFQSVFTEISQTPEGAETLQLMGKWDNASQSAAYNDPQIMRDFVEHRANGTFEVVDNEVHRLQVLGRIPANTPYVQAYAAVYQEIERQKVAQATEQVQTPAQPAPVVRQPVATRVATPAKEEVDPRVVAAQTGRPANRQVKTDPMDALANLDDAEFAKQMAKLVGQI